MVSGSRRDLSGLDTSVRWGIASLAFGAAFVHFAEMGDHFNISTAHGVFFAAAAWLQLAFGLAVVLRPSRRLFQGLILLSAAIIGTWIISRTVGVPFGTPEWEPESVGFPDVLSTVFEALTIGASLVVLSERVDVKRLKPSIALPAVGALSMFVVMLSTLSLVPAVAGDGHSHSHGSAANATVAAGAAADGHTHAAAPDVGGAGVLDQAGNIAVASGDSPCEQSGPPASEGQSSHGHRGPIAWQAIDDPDTRAALGIELAEARKVALEYPTAADAKNAGYIQVTGYVPCIGSHWIKVSLMDAKFDVSQPEMLLYDSSGLDGRMVGLSYWAATGEGTPPEGFAGPNDVWHQHIGLCIAGARVVGAESVSKEECEKRGGKKADGSNAWMVHAWVVPGWESAWGLFSGEHPELGVTVKHPST
jgi:hypothetical protein